MPYSLRKHRQTPVPVPKRKSSGYGYGGRKSILEGGAKNRKSARKEQLKKARELAHTIECEEKRKKTKKLNISLNNALEEARKYKQEHDINERKKIVTEIVVETLYCRRSSTLPRVIENSTRYLVTEEQEKWLRAWIRQNSLKPSGNRITLHILEALKNQFQLNLSLPQVHSLLHAMGIQWERLKNGYYHHKKLDEYNLHRRTLVAPFLWFLYNHCENVVVWNYDQCHPTVYDDHKYGWVDTTDPDHGKAKWLGTCGEGPSLTVSAFISRQFGLLVDDDGVHIGRDL